MKKNLMPLLAAGALLAPAHALADISYSYGQLDYQMVDADNDDGDGFQLGGSFELTPNVFVLGEYQDGDFDSGLEYTAYRLGAGYHAPVNEKVDWYGQFTWENYEVELDTPFGTASADEDGFGLEGGLRGMVTKQIELNGHVKYVDLGDNIDDTLIGVGALYHASQQFAVGAEYEDGDESTFSLFARFHF